MLIKKIIASPFFYILLVLIAGLVIFNKSFNLSLRGDELQMVWVTKGSLEKTGQWDYGIKQFHWEGYQFGALIMYLLTNYFGADGRVVYLFSFITRFLAASVLFYFLKKRGIGSIAAFLGSLLFMVTPIGLQATDWAKNFTSYISIAFFLLCLDSLLDLKSLRRIPIFLSTFAVSIYVNPIRAHGIIITVIFLLIFQLIFNKFVNKKSILLLLIGSMGIILLFSKLMIFGNAGQSLGGLIWQIVLILNKIFDGDLRSIRDLFILIGNGVLPKPSLTYFLPLVILLLIWKKYLFIKRYFLFTSLLNIIFLLALVNLGFQITLIAGIYFTLFSVTIFFLELFNKRISEAVIAILPFLLNISFILLPWSLMVVDTSQSINRYLIYPALSIPIILAFSLNQDQLSHLKDIFSVKLTSITLFVTALLLLMFSFATKSEIDNMYLRHNQYTAGLIWQQIYPYFDRFDFKTRRPILLFESDDPAMLHDTVLFGVDYRLGIRYKIWEENKLPLPLDSQQTMISMITDGKSSERYIGKEFVFPKEDVFYFKINGNTVSRVDIQQLLTK